MQCLNCNFTNPDQFKFCGACGTRIAPIAPQASQPPKDKTHSSYMSGDIRTVDAERRHITVMFCDMVGSTELSEQLDPEDFRLILNVYQNTCVYAVHQFEGHVAQYLGDGVLIYFGYPEAHEDDSQRAIRCGLEILNELKRLNELQKKYIHLNLEVRIGIHTGLVVVGDIGRDKSHGRLALGNTPNVAARLQTLADPNSVIISRATYRLVKNFFNCQALGSVSLKGVSHKMDVFKVLQEIAAPLNFQSQDADESTPFVGRENEVSKLVNVWDEVKKGSGKIALIIGEPGIGKTRLLKVFENRIKDEPHTWLLAHCISYYKNSAFYPIINMINSRLKFDKNETNTEKLNKLEQALAIVDFDLNEAVPIMASLLSIPITKPYRNPALTPQKLKEKTIQILLDWLIKSAVNKSYLFVIENLHWADSSTLEHLALLVDRIDKTQILIILTYHPRFHPDIEGKSRTLDIYLHRLSRLQIEHMVKEATGGKDLPDEVIDLVLTKTDGVPLFVEELTKMLIESEYLIEDDEKYLLKRSLPTKAIPDTLQDTLMARLDQLGAVKEVVQLAAIIGREFPYDLLRTIISLEDEVLQRELSNLVQADILEVQDGEQRNRYIFKQALIQDAAYNSVLKSTRAEYHRKIARIIEKQFKNFVNTYPQVVAYHYTEAGHYDRAIEYHLQAGRKLVQHSAHRDAIVQLKMGLKLLKHVDQEMKRNRIELEIQTCLGFPLLAVKGYGDKEVGRVYERARELCQTVGDVPQLFPALVGQYRFYLLRGDIARALDISEFLLSWAQTSSKSDLLLEANRAIGVTLFHIGEVSVGLQHLEEGIARYDRNDHADHKDLYVTDPLVTCLSYAALAQCLLGFRQKSNESGKQAIQHAKNIRHPYSRIFALYHHIWLHQFYRQTELVDKFTTELLLLCQEYGLPFWEISGLFFKGWVSSQRKRVDSGIAQMQKSISAFQATGAGSILPYFMTAIAKVYLENKQAEDALKWIDDAEAQAQKNGEHFFDAEIYRVKAEALFALSQKNKKRAESLLWRALETSRRQKLTILELRTLLSLVRMGTKKDETMRLLGNLCAWFAEDPKLSELQEAKKLLNLT